MENKITNVGRLSNNRQVFMKNEKKQLLTSRNEVCYGILIENPTK